VISFFFLSFRAPLIQFLKIADNFNDEYKRFFSDFSNLAFGIFWGKIFFVKLTFQERGFFTKDSEKNSLDSFCFDSFFQ